MTRILILLNVGIYLLQGFADDALLAQFALWPVGHFEVSDIHATVGFHVWQLVTSAFLHANVMHLGLNMLGLYMFGRDVERALGSRQYLLLYGAAVVFAALHAVAGGVMEFEQRALSDDWCFRRSLRGVAGFRL